ncbi:MAG: DUF5320 domain-containing protein [Pirellulales bacterium]|nr:DUF5320 domain-containing protein [Pirellulales bacterium]
MGPMTGRAAGYCAGFPVPGYMNPGFGRGGGGWGRGGGRGRGWRNWFHATGLTGWQRAAMGWPAGFSGLGTAAPSAPTTQDQQQEIEILKRQAEYLTGALDEVRKRLDELHAPPQEQK